MNAKSSQRNNPYVGPRSYEEKDRDYFYGRELECQLLLDSLISKRILLMYSNSGAGKTSLIQASLIPQIKENEKLFTIHPVIRVGLHPDKKNDCINRYVYSAIKSLNIEWKKTEDEFLNDVATTTLSNHISRIGEVEKKEETGQLFIFDQFEEIFTINPVDIEKKIEFFKELGELLESKHRWALFVMREEYIAQLDPYRHLIPYGFNNTFRLELLNQEAAKQAIEEPALKTGITFSEEAVEHLLNELSKISFLGPWGEVQKKVGIYVEPLILQVVCYKVWEEHDPSTQEIGLSHISKFGYIDRILSQFFEDCVQVAAERRNISESTIRSWCEEKLITSMKTRGFVSRGKIDTAGLPNKVVEQLVKRHLIRAEQRSGNIWYELIHDRFIEPIFESNRIWKSSQIISKGKLKSWLDEKAYELSRQRRLRRWANEPLDQFIARHPSSEGEQKMDWINSCLVFINYLIEKQVVLTLISGEDNYEILSQRWLWELQRFKAYFLWEKNGARYPDDANFYYNKSCEEIRELFIKPSSKEPIEKFGSIKEFLLRNFLDENGKLDQGKERVKELLNRKAEIIRSITGNDDHIGNYWKACGYAEKFYENVIPAIEDNCEDSVNEILYLFGYNSKSGDMLHYMVDCFEVVVSILYLPGEIITRLWERKKDCKRKT